MKNQRMLTWIINVVGGAAVLGSYVVWISNHPDSGDALWGALPESARGGYTVSMFLAALGYLSFTFFLLFAADLEQSRVEGGPGVSLFNLLYVAILAPSALWMPLTFAMIEAPSAALWWSIRGVLALVGVASIGMCTSLVFLRPRSSIVWHRLAIAGSLAFCFQTAVLDALVWPEFFETGL